MLNRNGYMSVEDQIKAITEDDVKQMTDDELVMWYNLLWSRRYLEKDETMIVKMGTVSGWVSTALEAQGIKCTFCDYLYKKLVENPSLIRYEKGFETEFFDTTSVRFDECGRVFMSGNDWTENNLQMKFCPKCGKYMSKLEQLCWSHKPNAT